MNDEASPKPLEEAMIERIHQLGLEGDPEFMIELIDSYAPLFQSQFHALQDACATRDATKLHHTAHSLKGAALNIGANELAACCNTIEDLGEQENIDAAEPLLAGLKVILDETLAALTSIRTRLSPPTPSA